MFGGGLGLMVVSAGLANGSLISSRRTNRRYDTSTKTTFHSIIFAHLRRLYSVVFYRIEIWARFVHWSLYPADRYYLDCIINISVLCLYQRRISTYPHLIGDGIKSTREIYITLLLAWYGLRGIMYEYTSAIFLVQRRISHLASLPGPSMHQPIRQ
jgi:hypothetical protein